MADRYVFWLKSGEGRSLPGLRRPQASSMASVIAVSGSTWGGGAERYRLARRAVDALVERMRDWAIMP
jgi:hypothetical protein